MKPYLSIITVNFHSDKWIRLLLDSVKNYTSYSYEVIITDNSNTLSDIENCTILPSTTPPRHWKGVEAAINEAKGKYILLLDSDAHIMRSGWDTEFVDILQGGYKIIACKGDELYDNLPLTEKYKNVLKPFRPFVMFFEKDYFINSGLSFKPYSIDDSKEIKKEFKKEIGNVYFDVGIYFCLMTIENGHEVYTMPITMDGYKCRKNNKWGTVWELNGKPTFYHHGYASRFTASKKEECCGRTSGEFLKSESDLFNEFYGK